jgi:hypothetical protein
MICSEKPVLTEDLCVVEKKKFSVTWYTVCVKRILDERSSIFVRDKLIFSSERMLRKDYYRRSSVEKKILVVGLKGLDAKTN